jgi:hypothetical protein
VVLGIGGFKIRFSIREIRGVFPFLLSLSMVSHFCLHASPIEFFAESHYRLTSAGIANRVKAEFRFWQARLIVPRKGKVLL